MNTLEDQSATMRQVLDEVAQGLGAGTPDYEIVESPCNGPGLTDKNRVDVYYRGALSGSESFVEVVHGVLDDRGWDYEDSASDSTHYVYARRNGMTLEIGRLSSGPEVSLVGRSTCM